MSSFLKKFEKNKKKDYKELYEIELKNRKLYEKAYRQKYKENIELQQESGTAELRKKLMEISDELEITKSQLSFVKEDRAKIYVKLEDTQNELKKYKEQEEKTKKGRKKKDGE